MIAAEFILYVAHQQKASDFYRAVFETEPLLNVPGMTEFLLLPGCKLGLMPQDNIAKIISPAMPHPRIGAGIPRAELYLYVNNPANFHARAIGAGAKEISPLQIRDWGDEAAYSADPDGHVLVFAKKM